jgi:hypothetical protein
MRRAMADILPESVCWRAGKGDLSPNFLLKIHRQESSRIENLLSDSKRLLADFVDIQNATVFYERKKLDELWPVIVLGLWFEQVDVPKQESARTTFPPERY